MAQQLIPTPDGKGRRAVIEVLINTPLVADLIRKGEVHKLKELMAPLERYTPRDTWGSWMRHIDHAQWPQFVELLLLEHYDPKYHRSQKSHAEKYNPPSTDIHVKSYSQADLDDAVLRLVSE